MVSNSNDDMISRIHGYRGRVRVGRGIDKKGYLSNWTGAVTQKTPVNAEKANGD